MSRLLHVGKRFRALYYTVNGTPFYGQMLDIPDTSRVSNFLSTRRYLRTQPITIIKPREVVIIDGMKHVVAEHGTGFFVLPIYKHFKLFEVNSIERWYKKSALPDPVTGVKKIERENDAGDIYLSVQPKTDIEDSVKVQHNTRLCITNANVSVDDRVGDWVVTKSDIQLGVTVIEMKSL